MPFILTLSPSSPSCISSDDLRTSSSSFQESYNESYTAEFDDYSIAFDIDQSKTSRSDTVRTDNSVRSDRNDTRTERNDLRTDRNDPIRTDRGDSRFESFASASTDAPKKKVPGNVPKNAPAKNVPQGKVSSGNVPKNLPNNVPSNAKNVPRKVSSGKIPSAPESDYSDAFDEVEEVEEEEDNSDSRDNMGGNRSNIGGNKGDNKPISKSSVPLTHDSSVTYSEDSYNTSDDPKTSFQKNEDSAWTGLPHSPKMSPQESRFLVLNRRKRGAGRDKKRYG